MAPMGKIRPCARQRSLDIVGHLSQHRQYGPLRVKLLPKVLVHQLVRVMVVEKEAYVLLLEGVENVGEGAVARVL